VGKNLGGLAPQAPDERGLCVIDRPQRVQNTLARVVLQKLFSAHLTQVQRELHWLPIRQRTTYKIAAIT